jgi:hypothetical protein
MSWYGHSRKHSLCAKGIKTGRHYNRLSNTSRRRLQDFDFYITDEPLAHKEFQKEVYKFGTKASKKKAPVAYSQVVNVMRKHPEVIGEIEKGHTKAYEESTILYSSRPPVKGNATGRAFQSPRFYWVRPPKRDKKIGLNWDDDNKGMILGKDGKLHERWTGVKSTDVAETFLHEQKHIDQYERGQKERKQMDKWNKRVPYENRPHEVEARRHATDKTMSRLELGSYPSGKEISKTLDLEHDEGSYNVTNWGKKDEVSQEERRERALQNIYKNKKR